VISVALHVKYCDILVGRIREKRETQLHENYNDAIRTLNEPAPTRLAARYDLISKHLSTVPTLGRREISKEKPREEKNIKGRRETKEMGRKKKNNKWRGRRRMSNIQK